MPRNSTYIACCSYYRGPGAVRRGQSFRPSFVSSLSASRSFPMAVQTPPAGKRSRVRGTPKGRRVDPQSKADVVALLGDEPRRRDLLIEHLHKIQDKFGHLSAGHLAALADELKMAMA